jgi:hypothetical protein
MNESDDAFLMTLNNLTFEEYLKFRTTHKRVQEFDKRVECKTNIIVCNNDNKKRIADMVAKYQKIKFCIKMMNVGEKDNLIEFANVHSLDLSGTNVVDVSMLGNVHTLNLAWTNVVNVSALGNVYNLNLSDTKVVDASALSNVHELDLSWTHVVDVSALKNVNTLNLAGTNVVDVSALGNVNTLKLLYCDKITDISCLVNVKNIKISRNNNIKKFGSRSRYLPRIKFID